jgi:hypothetical protein
METMNRIRETLAACRSARPLAVILALAVTDASAQPARDTPPCAGQGDLLCGDIAGPVDDPDAAAERDPALGDDSGPPRPDTPADTAAGAIAGADAGPTGDVVPRRRPPGMDSPAVEGDGLRPRRRADPELKGGGQRPRPRAGLLDIPEPERQAAPARPRAPVLQSEGE